MTAMSYIDPRDWIMIERPGLRAYPFTEDENANITGLGHQDPAVFAAEIDRYDREVGGMDPSELGGWESAVVHRWAVLHDDGERLNRAAQDTPGAIPVTCLWGQR